MMELRGRKVAPVIGGVTAAATALGAFAPAAQVAVAAPDHAAGATSPLGLAQEGVFESCSAYFGFGKDEDGGAANVVAFDVTDQPGGEPDDGHDVGTDVDVVLVLETTEGDVIECIPEEVTEAEWNDFYGEDILASGNVPWPGPGYYAYPPTFSELGEGPGGEFTSVGFRVIGVPGDHTLVSPNGVQPLADPFGAFITQVYGTLSGGGAWSPNPATLEVISNGAGADALAAYEAAAAACSEGLEGTVAGSEDLTAALMAVLEYLGMDEEVPPGELEGELDCEIIVIVDFYISYVEMVEAQAANREPIVLAAPAQETTTTTAAPTAPPTGAQPVTAAPTYTG